MDITEAIIDAPVNVLAHRSILVDRSNICRVSDAALFQACPQYAGSVMSLSGKGYRGGHTHANVLVLGMMSTAALHVSEGYAVAASIGELHWLAGIDTLTGHDYNAVACCRFAEEVVDVDALFFFASSHPIFTIAAALTLVVVSCTWILAARPLKPMSPEEATRLRGADAAAKNRMWEHALHEDNFFNDRLNFFLVFESVSFGVIGALFTREPSDDTILRLLALFGLFVSLLWMYIQARNKNLLDVINAREDRKSVV